MFFLESFNFLMLRNLLSNKHFVFFCIMFEINKYMSYSLEIIISENILSLKIKWQKYLITHLIHLQISQNNK